MRCCQATRKIVRRKCGILFCLSLNLRVQIFIV